MFRSSVHETKRLRARSIFEFMTEEELAEGFAAMDAGPVDADADADLMVFPAEHEASITTDRLVLTPLLPDDADEMVGVLGDPALHRYIGGQPASLAELRERYRLLAAGSPYPGEVWRNWIVRVRADRSPVGTVQATVVHERDGRTAAIAWVIGVPWQGRGFAAEAARALVGWLRAGGVRTITANIHPDHHASAGVAARAGLTVTDEIIDGEQVWRTAG
jgi:RimJ/RimL family protein N-acetyltransferase